MKQLDEMERRIAFCLDDQWSQYRDLARFLRAVMPVVRAAIELYESDYIDATMGGGICIEDRDLYDKLAAVYDAIDTLRRGMGEE